MVETIENVSQYHDIISLATGKAFELSVGTNNKSKDDARQLMRILINYAFTQYQLDLNPEISISSVRKLYNELKLDNLSIEELTTYMSFYQKLAHQSGVQKNDGRAKIFGDVKGMIWQESKGAL